MITNALGKNIRRREVKICRFSVQAFQEEKQTQPQTQDRTFTWEAAISSSSSCCSVFSGNVMLQIHTCVLRKYLQRHPHSSLTCNHFTYRQKDLEKLKKPTSPVLCFRRDSGTVTSYLETSLWTYFLIVLSPQRAPNPLLTQTTWADWLPRSKSS